MRVRVEEYPYQGPIIDRGECDTYDAIPDDTERLVVEGELRRMGRAWIGGGASPLVLLIRVT